MKNNHQLERAARLAASNITAIEAVTDNITVTGAVNLDSIKSSIDATPIGLNTYEGRIKDLGGDDSTLISKAVDYTLVADDCIVLVDSTSGHITLTLPTAVSITGKRYIIKLIEATNTCIIDGSGAETVDGATTKVLSVLNAFVTIVSDGTNWRIIG